MRLDRTIVLAWGLLGGCGPAVATDEGMGEGGTSGDTTGGTGTTATTTVGTTMTTTTVGTTMTTTTGPEGCAGDWVSGCQTYCAALITCHPELGAYEDCVNGCIDGFSELTPDCQVAYCEAYTCMGGLDCATFDAGTPECNALGGAADELCMPIGDPTSATSVGDEDGGCYVGGNELECEWGCVAQDHRFHCAQGTCTCYEGDIPVASCADASACDNWDLLSEEASACCGW